MTLEKLNPKYGTTNGERTHIIFDCPVCLKHRISVPFAGQGNKWEKSGVDFKSTTLSPSIAHQTSYADGMNSPARKCKSHFFIRNGEIKLA